MPYSSFRKTAPSLDWRTARVYGKRSIGNVVSDVVLQPIVPVNRITLNVVITKPEVTDETPVE